MDCSLPGSSINGIFQARVLEWVAISFSRGSSWPRDRTLVSRIVGRRFTVWATSEDFYSGDSEKYKHKRTYLYGDGDGLVAKSCPTVYLKLYLCMIKF